MFAVRNLLYKLIRLPYLPVILGPFILFAGPLIKGQTLFWGLPALQFIPWQSYAWQQISQGMIPLWNPLNGMGAPFLANYQLALFYPPTWLGYIFAAIGGTPALAWAQTLLIPVHLVFAGMGMIFLTRRLGVNILAQSISGLSFALSGYFVARSGFYSMIWAGSWLPWIIWSASKFSMPVKGGQTRQKGISPALVICLSFQLLSGHAQLSWYTILLAALWVYVGGWVNGGWRRAFSSLWILFYHGIIAVGIASIQLIPTAEYLIASQRSTAVDFELGLTYSFWPWRLLTLLAPNMFGNPGTGNYWGYASFWEDAIYMGVLPLALAFSSVVRIGRKGSTDIRQPLIRFAWGIMIISLVLALGNNTPIFPFLYNHIPTFSLFNAPARWMIWFVFMVSLLAGIGATVWTPPVGEGLKRFRRLTAASLAVTLGALITWVLLREIRITFIEATAFLGIWATGVCVLTLTKPSGSAHPKFMLWQWLAVGWLLVDLVWSNWSSLPAVPVHYLSNPLDIPLVSATTGRVLIDSQLEYNLKFHRFFRFSDYTPIEDWNHLWEINLPDMNLLPGNQFSYVNNFDPLVQGDFARWMDWLEGLPEQIRASIYPLMDVDTIVERDISNPLGVITKEVNNAERVRFFPCAEILQNEESVWGSLRQEVSASGGSFLDQKVFLESDHSAPDAACSAPTSTITRIITDQPGFIRMQVGTNQDGFLVLSDSYYPGWTARLDGVETQIYKADTIFRAVSVNQGSHILEFTYRPLSFYIGAGFSFFSILIMVLITRHRVK